MRHWTRRMGLSAASTVLLAVMPKCPLCWIALMSTIGVTWPASSGWLRSFVVVLSLVPLGILLVWSHQSQKYWPLILGLMAAIALYICKFRLALDAGVYLSGAMLFAATLWSAKSMRHRTSEIICCYPSRLLAETAIPTGCASMSHSSSEVFDG